MKSETDKKYRSGHGPGFGKGILQDIRFSLRMLRKNIGFSAIVILMLALGVAGNFIMFSVYNGIYLRPLPVPGGERFVNLDETAPLWNLEYTGLRYSDFHSWRENSRSFEVMAAFSQTSCNLSFEGTSERVRGLKATHDLTSLFGIIPILGRAFSADDDSQGGDKVILLSNSLWKRKFGGKEDVIGKTLKLDDVLFTIIGVLPQNPFTQGQFFIPEGGFCIPLQLDPNNLLQSYYLMGFGRLKEGVSIKKAEEELRLIHSGLVEKNRASGDTAPIVTPFKERQFGSDRLGIQVSLAAMCVVLLIACGNIAAMMLARGLARSREFVIRSSLGATPWRLARLIGVESLMFSALGGLAGLLLGYWGLQAFLNTISEKLSAYLNFGMDWRVCLFIGSMVVLSAFLGVLPVIYSTLKLELRSALEPSSRQSTTAAPGRRGLRLLVAAELALTLVLMIQAGLLVQTFSEIQKVDPGFRSDHLLVYEIDLEGIAYESQEAKTAFFKNHLEAVRNLPGVISAGAIDLSPLCGSHNGTFYTIENAPPKKPGESHPVALYRSVFPGYFETMGISILAGRSFTEQDGLNQASMAAIVDKAFAERYWPNDNPIGKRIHPGIDDGESLPEGIPEPPWLTVVGVAKDVKHYGLDQVGHPGVYLPFAQEPRNGMSMVLRTSVEPESLVPSIREMVHRSDADLPVFGVTTMVDRLFKSMAVRRLGTKTFGIFSGIALLMAIGGIYGVFSYVVARRTQEIGVRMALGARRRNVLQLVLKDNLFLSLIGIGIGLAFSLMMTPLTESLLVGISPFDPLIFIGVSLLLTAVSMLACWLPARRATKIQPMEALRYE